MKRDENLQALSREHHLGLLLGWKIRQGLKYLVDPNVIAEYIQYFFKKGLLPHFKEEENIILSYLQDDNELKLRTIEEHQTMARQIKALSENILPEAEALLEIASFLDNHIRFEERELFPYLEKQLSPDQLSEIGAAIESNHRPYIEDFTPEFWTGHVK